jgi:hypothetical protein
MMKQGQENKPTFGEIIGCASAKITNHANKIDFGLTRFYQILISEAAYKIWSIRCKRVISNDNDRSKWPSEDNIKKDLLSQINLRLRMDCLHTNECKFDKKALSSGKVTATWKGLLRNEGYLPENWASNPGVLVGIR